MTGNPPSARRNLSSNSAPGPFTHRPCSAVGSLAASRLIASLLFDVSPTDLVTFIVVPMVLAVAALLATYLPALRATRIDPMVALRYE